MKQFQILSFQLLNNEDLVLVQYVGNDTLVEDFPHHNSKLNEKPYVRVCPSVISNIKSSDPSEPPSQTYKKQMRVDNPPQLNAILKPTSTQQVSNHKAVERQKFRISHDGLYNLHEITYDLGGYVSKIVTYPDLVVVCALPALLNETNRVLQLKSSSSQLLSYDTTFQLGNFYVSVLLFGHPQFAGAPVIPACFLVHEHKFQSLTRNWWSSLPNSCLSLPRMTPTFLLSLMRREPSFLQSTPTCQALWDWGAGTICCAQPHLKKFHSTWMICVLFYTVLQRRTTSLNSKYIALLIVVALRECRWTCLLSTCSRNVHWVYDPYQYW